MDGFILGLELYGSRRGSRVFYSSFREKSVLVGSTTKANRGFGQGNYFLRVKVYLAGRLRPLNGRVFGFLAYEEGVK